MTKIGNLNYRISNVMNPGIKNVSTNVTTFVNPEKKPHFDGSLWKESAQTKSNLIDLTKFERNFYAHTMEINEFKNTTGISYDNGVNSGDILQAAIQSSLIFLTFLAICYVIMTAFTKRYSAISPTYRETCNKQQFNNNGDPKITTKVHSITVSNLLETTDSSQVEDVEATKMKTMLPIKLQLVVKKIAICNIHRQWMKNMKKHFNYGQDTCRMNLKLSSSNKLDVLGDPAYHEMMMV